MGEADLTSIMFGFILFIVFLIGGGLFLAENLSNNGITDNTSNTLTSGDITALEGNMSILIGDTEEQQENAAAGDDSTYDRTVNAIGKVLNKVNAIKTIKETSQHLIQNTLEGVPLFIYVGIFGMLSLLIVMLVVRAWQKIRP